MLWKGSVMNPNGPIGGTVASTTPAKPQPAAPLTDEQLRLQCVTLAITAKVDSRYLTEGAGKLYDYIKSGSIGGTGTTYGHIG